MTLGIILIPAVILVDYYTTPSLSTMFVLSVVMNLYAKSEGVDYFLSSSRALCFALEYENMFFPREIV